MSKIHLSLDPCAHNYRYCLDPRFSHVVAVTENSPIDFRLFRAKLIGLFVMAPNAPGIHRASQLAADGTDCTALPEVASFDGVPA